MTRFDLTAAVPAVTALGRVHLIGVGGVGMSGIARIMATRGVPVSGSDAKDVPVLDSLRALGADVAVGFDPDRLEGVGTVVVSSAVRDDNPELVRARDAGLRVLHRAQALQSLMLGRRAVAVAGTNGKTTTSAMLTVLLRHAGWDPSFAVGGELVDVGTNADDGAGDVFVAEADESDSSFLVYTPAVSVVTNVQPDHLDHYGTPAAVEEAFAEFSRRLGPDGVLVTCRDDPGAVRLADLAREEGRRVLTFGEHPEADVRLTDLATTPGGTRFHLVDRRGAGGGVRLPVPGHHNALDAAAAYTAAVALGVGADAARAGLEVFSGARRRFELRGSAGGVRVFDDYAHNAPKVAAAVATGRQAAADGQVLVVFQPHLYSRTQDFARELAAGLSVADHVVLMDVYAAREDPVPGVSGELVARHVSLPDGRVAYVPDRADVVHEVLRRVRPGDVVLTVGAGDVTALGPELLSALQDRGVPEERTQP